MRLFHQQETSSRDLYIYRTDGEHFIPQPIINSEWTQQPPPTWRRIEEVEEGVVLQRLGDGPDGAPGFMLLFLLDCFYCNIFALFPVYGAALGRKNCLSIMWVVFLHITSTNSTWHSRYLMEQSKPIYIIPNFQSYLYIFLPSLPLSTSLISFGFGFSLAKLNSLSSKTLYSQSWKSLYS